MDGEFVQWVETGLEVFVGGAEFPLPVRDVERFYGRFAAVHKSDDDVSDGGFIGLFGDNDVSV